MRAAMHRTDHIRLTDMQLITIKVLQEKYTIYTKPEYGIVTSEFLTY